MSALAPGDLQAISPITLTEDWDCGIGGGIWSNGLVLASYFTENKALMQERLKGTRCLELGSGNGWLAAVLASVVVDCEVVVTDTKEHLPLMEKTVVTNLDKIPGDKNRVSCAELLWGEQTLPGKFDFIFGTDVAYRDYLHVPLIDCLKTHLSKEGSAMIGVCMHDTTTHFFDRLKEQGLVYERVRDELMPERYRGQLFAMIIIEWASC
jgi:predicted nicotinamide N-methyase